MTKQKIMIIGGGIAGLSMAFHLTRQRDFDVLLLDAGEVGGMATAKAAGMITPAPEVQLGEEVFADCIIKSAAYYPDFVNELTGNQPDTIDFHQSGTIMCATDTDGKRDLQRLVGFQRSLGIQLYELTNADILAKEPRLTHRIASAYYIKDEAYLDNLKLTAFLKQVLIERGCVIREHNAVKNISFNNHKISSVTLSDGTNVEADSYVLATGIEHGIAALSAALPLPMRRIKGQALALQGAKGDIRHPIRFFNRYSTYLVPRASGEIVIGATSEELHDDALTAGAVLDLIYAAWQVLPHVYDLPLIRTWTGFRPTTPDHKPIAGTCDIQNLFLLLGLYRHGIKTGPYFAREVAKLICGQNTELPWGEFNIKRFAM